jgi:hypothetical protein
MIRWFTSLHGLLLAVLFCLPWMTISCPGPNGRKPGENETTLRGYSLAISKGDIPHPHAPGTKEVAPRHSYWVLDAPHPSYLLIAILSLGMMATLAPKLRCSASFRGSLLAIWIGACVVLGLGAWRDHQLYKGDPWDYHLRWEPAFWMTLVALPLAGVWLIPKRDD